jgi:hypothetical protein
LKIEWRQSSPGRIDRVGVRGGSAIRKIGRSKAQEQTGQPQRYLPLREFGREALWDTVVLSGLAFVEEELEAERTGLCGPHYAHIAERKAIRAGLKSAAKFQVFILVPNRITIITRRMVGSARLQR